MFITNGVRADFIVTAVKTTHEGGHHGISFLDRRQRRGRQRVASSRSSAGTPRTPALIAFDDVFVPEENLLGEEQRAASS